MRRVALLIPLVVVACSCPSRLNAAEIAVTDPAEADADFAIQGEYTGEVVVDGRTRTAATQVIALGEGRFRAMAFWGGLPGAGWDRKGPFPAEGQRTEDGVMVRGEGASARIDDGQIHVTTTDGKPLGTLRRTERKSPTLGQEPPPGAIILFNGKDTQQWDNGQMTGDLLQQGTTSRLKFQDHTLHVEFCLPYQPLQRGQGRGNSGVYLQGRYEVQVLDSFGLEGLDNECGGIYSIKAPDVNMCLPPLAWQTYDIEFTAAKYDAQQQIVKQPRMTVRHNGVVVQQDVELPHATTAAPLQPGPEPGPLYLQDHGCPVRYRNIWVVVREP